MTKEMVKIKIYGAIIPVTPNIHIDGAASLFLFPSVLTRKTEVTILAKTLTYEPARASISLGAKTDACAF